LPLGALGFSAFSAMLKDEDLRLLGRERRQSRAQRAGQRSHFVACLETCLENAVIIDGTAAPDARAPTE